MKLYFYWNLHRGEWSRMQQGKVTGRFESVVMDDVEFRVRPGGHARVIREGRKNVHAFAIADRKNVNVWEGSPGCGLRGDEFIDCRGGPWVEISYNPFKGASFFRKDTGQPITYAEKVALTNDKRVFADPDRRIR